MIPIRDINPSRSTPFVVWFIIAINTLVFLFELSLNDQQLQAFAYMFGLVPERLPYLLVGEGNNFPVPVWMTFITHMFIHGGFLHIIFNMWFLFIFGDNVEDSLGHFRFAIFYLLCGLSAAIIQTLLTSNPSVPMIGASGAIAGVMGAYLWLFPHARIVTLIPVFIFFYFVEIPAVFFLGFWFFIQIFNGSGSYVASVSGGVAWWAHAGGFVTGIILVMTIFKPRFPPRRFGRRYSESLFD